MIDLGIVKPGATVYIPFGSYAGSTGASSAASNYADADILVYKNGSTTQRASSSGLTATTTFDTVTGINLCAINLADNTTAGFWEAGADYFVIVGPITVDSQTVNFPIAHFTIGMPGATLNTTIATLSSQTSFTLTNGPAEDDALNGCVVYIHDVASAVQGGFAVVSDYTGSTKTVTLTAGTTFTAAASDNISFFPPSNDHWFNALKTVALPLTPTTAGRALTVDASGRGLADVDTIKTQTLTASGGITFPAATLASTTNITAGTITTTTNLTNLPSIPANWITTAGITDGAFTAAKFAAASLNGKGDWNIGKTGYSLTATTGLGNQTADITGNLSGSVGSVTGAVGSVTGNVGGNVAGSVGSVTGAVGSVTGNVGGNVVGSVASVTAAVAITSNVKKNQALAAFEFLMTDSTNHAPATGLTVSVTRSINGGAFGAGTLSAVTEVGNGIYSVDFGAGDLNGNVIVLQATAVGADTTFERIVTQP